jgi:hypothetical protein
MDGTVIAFSSGGKKFSADPDERIVPVLSESSSRRLKTFKDWLGQYGDVAKSTLTGAWTGMQTGWHNPGKIDAISTASKLYVNGLRRKYEAQEVKWRANRLFTEDAAFFIRYPGLSSTDHKRLDGDWLASRDAYVKEIERADTLELERRQAVIDHKKRKAALKPLTRLRHARNEVLNKLEIERLAAVEVFAEAAKEMKNAEKEFENTMKKTWPLIHWGIRSRARRRKVEAEKIYAEAKDVFKKEEKRVRLGSRRGFLGGRLFGRRLRSASLKERDQARSKYAMEKSTHEAENAGKHEEILQIKGSFVRRVKGTARQELRKARRDIRDEKRGLHGGHRRHSHRAKRFANRTGNFVAGVLHEAKAAASFAIAGAIPPVATVDAKITSSLKGAIKHGFEAGRNAFRSRKRSPGSAPAP